MVKKTMILLSSLLIMAFATVTTSCDDDKEKTIGYDELPSAAQQFIANYFGGSEVKSIIKDTDDGRDDFDVIFADGTEIDFDASGNWESIDCRFSSLPKGILPDVVEKDVEQRYPKSTIYGAEREIGGLKVEINAADGLQHDLYYDNDGKFVRDNLESASANKNMVKVDYSTTPSTTRDFISRYFPNAKVLSAEKDVEDGEYEVLLSDGTEIDFTSAGEWKSIDCGRTVLPKGILPSAVEADVETRVAGASVYGAEKELNGLKVEARKANGSEVELYYDNNGKFVRQENDNDNDHDHDGNVDTDETPVGSKELPAASLKFLDDNFAGVEIISVVKDTDRDGVSYDVVLANGVEIDFDADGNWDSVDGNRSELPKSILPAAIAADLDSRYGSTAVLLSAERERSGYSVEVRAASGLSYEAIYDNSFKFVRQEVEN